MRVFKNKWFDKFCKKQGIDNSNLYNLVVDIESGKIDVDYGGGLIKQRLARKNSGKSSGYRCIILYKINENIFFVYGFAKKDRDNLDLHEEITFKDLAKEMLSFNDAELNQLVKNKILIEVSYEEGK